MLKSRMRLLGIVAAGALVFAACGGGDDDSAVGATETQAPTTTEAMDDESMEDSMDEESMADESMEESMDDESMEEMSEVLLNLDVSTLPALDGGLHYEGWVIVDGSPVSTGKFQVDGGLAIDLDGNAVDHHGHGVDVSAASAVVITIEPAGDSDTVPALTKIVGGDVVDGSAELTIAHPAALGSDFADAAGSFIIATPTDDDDSNELSGVWFLTMPGPEAGLSLPELPEGWVYEGWAVIDGSPISTGRFTDVAAADDAATFSGPNEGPPFPGEDFLVNAPEGVEFPTNLQGATIVISIEPDPDDSPAPFALKPLVGEVPADAEIAPTSYDLGQNLEFPVVSARIG